MEKLFRRLLGWLYVVYFNIFDITNFRMNNHHGKPVEAWDKITEKIKQPFTNTLFKVGNSYLDEVHVDIFRLKATLMGKDQILYQF